MGCVWLAWQLTHASHRKCCSSSIHSKALCCYTLLLLWWLVANYAFYVRRYGTVLAIYMATNMHWEPKHTQYTHNIHCVWMIWYRCIRPASNTYTHTHRPWLLLKLIILIIMILMKKRVERELVDFEWVIENFAIK